MFAHPHDPYEEDGVADEEEADGKVVEQGLRKPRLEQRIENEAREGKSLKWQLGVSHKDRPAGNRRGIFSLGNLFVFHFGLNPTLRFGILATSRFFR